MPGTVKMQIEYFQKPIFTFKPYLAPNPNIPIGTYSFTMINRVHNAKAGCSACGKKVM
jgi:hypothetical protein